MFISLCFYRCDDLQTVVHTHAPFVPRADVQNIALVKITI